MSLFLCAHLAVRLRMKANQRAAITLTARRRICLSMIVIIDETVLAAVDEIASVMLCIDRVMRHIASELAVALGRGLDDDDGDTIDDDLADSTEAPELDNVMPLITGRPPRESQTGKSSDTPP